MKNISIIAATAATLLATSALAQQAPSTTSPSAVPAQTQTSPSATSPSATGSAPMTTAKAPVSFIKAQSADQIMASDLMGMSVRGAQDESIGEIDDMLVDPQGRVVAAVIGVGGFLGIGEKDVAIPFESIQLAGTSSDRHVVLSKTKDELKAAPSFETYDDVSTTGSVTPKQPAASPATAPASTR